MSTWAGRNSINTLVFDVLGTVVDEKGTTTAATIEALAPTVGRGRAESFATEWTRRFDELMDEVRRGAAAWRSTDVLHAQSLTAAVDAADLPPIDSSVLANLARVGDRLAPWPDSPSALIRLSGVFGVVALSNGTMTQLFRMSAAGGLRWHTVLSSEMVKAYKPDAAMYRLALDQLDLDPSRSLMVACHPWDLRAAAQQGLRTAHVSRPEAQMPETTDDFDVYADDLLQLADQLLA